MKIAQVSTHYLPVIGGQEVYIKNLKEVLAQAGHETLVFQINRGERASDAVCYRKLPAAGRYIQGFEYRWLNSMVTLLRPRKLFGADAIISHYAAHARPLESVAGKTVILSHGVEWRTEQQQSFDRWREGNARWCLDKFVHVVNDTHYLRYLGIDAAPGQGYFTEIRPGKWFIPNCVDTVHFSPGPGKPEYAGKKMILVPRQMVADRGIHLAIDAFALLARRDPQVEMCLLGKRWNPQGEYIRRLDRMIAESGMQDRVYFRDPVPNAEMPQWYRSAAVTLIPTLRREGTSLSALESMACGVATVSTNVVGLADLPTRQCSPDAESIAQALSDTLFDRARIGADQREVMVKIFNMPNWGKSWLEVLMALYRAEKGIQFDG